MDGLSKLSITISNPNLPLKQKLTAICKTIKREIKEPHQVSLWVFKNGYSAIEQIGGYDEQNQYIAGGVLQRADYPEYFDYILNNHVLNASNARSHPATSCFNSTYFAPNNIYSLLDIIYHHDFEPKGIICCEAVNAEIVWDPLFIEKLKRIANISSIFFSKSLTDLNE
ncbi:hypothetical protein AAD001_01405 [Colwelliaceae bacterium 6471]